jgi:CheY-like chemotaxis protein
MSGLVATQKLRELGYNNIVVGFTGNAMEEDVDEFLMAGADLVLPKPLKMSYLDNLLLYCHAHGTRTSLSGSGDEKLADRKRLSAVLGLDKN